MLDEAGDLNEVTLAIFNLLPATRKVMVGDPYQNIYTFNHTIDGFAAMRDQGPIFPMSQSFRVADHLAARIESFGRKFLASDFTFSGIPATSSTITSKAYISRTNAALIARMIELNASKTPYGLARKASQIFEIPLAVCSFRHRGFIANPELKHLQSDIDDYFESPTLQREFKSLYLYLKDTHPNDFTLNKTIQLIQRYGKSTIIACYEEARKHEKSCQSLTLGTVHSMKGLEYDQVELADDVNEAIIDAITFRTLNPDAQLPLDMQTELYLFYVACTRARFSLINSHHL
jgi:superfamily I DNA/RNA helicase